MSRECWLDQLASHARPEDAYMYPSASEYFASAPSALRSLGATREGCIDTSSRLPDDTLVTLVDKWILPNGELVYCGYQILGDEAKRIFAAIAPALKTLHRNQQNLRDAERDANVRSGSQCDEVVQGHPIKQERDGSRTLRTVLDRPVESAVFMWLFAVLSVPSILLFVYVFIGHGLLSALFQIFPAASAMVLVISIIVCRVLMFLLIAWREESIPGPQKGWGAIVLSPWYFPVAFVACWLGSRPTVSEQEYSDNAPEKLDFERTLAIDHLISTGHASSELLGGVLIMGDVPPNSATLMYSHLWRCIYKPQVLRAGWRLLQQTQDGNEVVEKWRVAKSHSIPGFSRVVRVRYQSEC